MADKVFGSDFTDTTNPAGTETVSINDAGVFKDVTLANVVSQVPHNATSKATPVDADEIGIWDSVAVGLKKLTWANLKATLKTYFDTLYDWATVAHAATGKTTPIDADELSIVDSAASNVIKKLTWANLKATLKTYFDTLYPTTLITNTADLMRVDSCGASGWTGTINGAPAGAVVTYTHVSGNKNTLVPNNTNQLAKQRLYNTTRGNNALISTSNGSSTITLTATAPANWANGDTITTISPTLGSMGGVNGTDWEITAGELLGKTKAIIYFGMLDNTAANILFNTHPFEAYAASKEKNFRNQVANILEAKEFSYIIKSNVISLGWGAGGAATNIVLARQQGYFL